MKEIKDNAFLGLSILIAFIILGSAMIYSRGLEVADNKSGLDDNDNNAVSDLTETIADYGVELPIVWGDLGQRLVDSGTIDMDKMKQLYQGRGGITAETLALLTNDISSEIKINNSNAGHWLNILWAFGLANKNEILESGPMQSYGDASRMASTGGWPLASGNPMDHYSKHQLVVLTTEQQKLVERVSKNIYRPCCDNSTHFPDCNHGMAMLGLLELMAASGASEQKMYEVALAVNRLWFADSYAVIEQFLSQKGFSMATVDPKVILGKDYSSASGFRKVLNEVKPVEGGGGGGSCGA